MSESPHTESTPNKKVEQGRMVQTLENHGASIVAEKTPGIYVLSFKLDDAVTTIRISLEDLSGADLVITHMTTLPEEKINLGLGSSALQNLLSWARENNLADIRAVQVQNESESFWTKNGFAKCAEPNPTNDFTLKTV